MRRFTGQLTGNLTQVNDMAEGAKGEGRRRKTAVIEKDWRDIITIIWRSCMELDWNKSAIKRDF